MEAYMNKGIKEVIGEFPAIEAVLEEYGIGCGPCAVGTCLLKDIVDIHALPADQQAVMMAKIAKVIQPDKPIPIPTARSKPDAKPREPNYSPPMKILVEEHKWIKRWVALIPVVSEGLDLERAEDRRLIREGIDFIRSYADRFHHAKEEDILFKYFDENLDILKVMHADHKQARSHVAAMLEALEKRDTAALSEHLEAYAALLTDHIRKEDDILFPWMDRNLTVSQVGELYSKFYAAERDMDADPKKYEKLVDRLEKQFKSQGGQNETA